jgi:hypothetical protein
VQSDARGNLNPPGSARWCAWQESNLLPLAPQASALSGELQAHSIDLDDSDCLLLIASSVRKLRAILIERLTRLQRSQPRDSLCQASDEVDVD